MMGGVAGTVGGMTGEAIKNAEAQTNQDSMDIFKQKLENLMLMKEMGALSDDEFNEQKKKLLESI